MERRLKERLVGAAILVVLIVLVVPELLSGPKRPAQPAANSQFVAESHSEPTRTVTVDLDTKRTMALEAPPDAGAIVGGAAPPASTAPASAPPALSAATPPLPATATVAAPATLSPATLDNHGVSAKAWSLQLGVFASRANAEQLLRTVKAHNSPAYLTQSGSGKSERWRVKVGPLADRSAADRMLAKLKSEGHAASLVAP